MIEFLSRSDMTYTNPGRQDNVHTGKVDGEPKYLSRQYLLQTLKDLLDIINGSELHSSNFVPSFSEKPSFSQLYDFIKSHKQFVYDKNMPHTSCLCDTCEYIVLLAIGLNNYKQLTASARLPETPHDIVEKYSCSSDDKNCMFDDCTECSSAKLCQLPDSNPDSESFLDSNSDSNTSCLVFFYRWKTINKHVTKMSINQPFEEDTERFKESVVSQIADIHDNHCALCLEDYQQRKEEWIQCPGLCQQWYYEQCFFNQFIIQIISISLSELFLFVGRKQYFIR